MLKENIIEENDKHIHEIHPIALCFKIDSFIFPPKRKGQTFHPRILLMKQK